MLFVLQAVTLCDEIRECVNNRNMKQEVFKSIAEIVRPLENKKSTPENRELVRIVLDAYLDYICMRGMVE